MKGNSARKRALIPDRPAWQRRLPALGGCSAAGVAALTLLGAAAAIAAPLTISQPIRVRLHWTEINAGFSIPTYKLGIHASLGGSMQPRLFEFDTGGAGFYATYHSADGINPSTPWWGTEVTPTNFSFEQSYDGGNINYNGPVVSTSVSLFDDQYSSAPKLTATDVIVGQATAIQTTSPGPSPWPLPPPYGHTTPPLEGAFWGDFGMATQQGKEGMHGPSGVSKPILDSLLSQMQFAPAIKQGFRVHASLTDPWVQFGLGPEDLSLQMLTTFALTPAPADRPQSSLLGIPYTDKHVLKGLLAISNASSAFSKADTGMILDTGAFTTIHDDSRIPIALRQGGRIVDGADVLVGAVSLQPAGLSASVPFLSFQAGQTVDADLVSVDNGGDFYLNTGMLPFLSYDVIYNLSDMQLTLVPQSVPAPLGFSGVAAAAALSRRIRALRERLGRRDRLH